MHRSCFMFAAILAFCLFDPDCLAQILFRVSNPKWGLWPHLSHGGRMDVGGEWGLGPWDLCSAIFPLFFPILGQRPEMRSSSGNQDRRDEARRGSTSCSMSSESTGCLAWSSRLTEMCWTTRLLIPSWSTPETDLPLALCGRPTESQPQRLDAKARHGQEFSDPSHESHFDTILTKISTDRAKNPGDCFGCR